MGQSGINAETGQSWVGTPLANLSSYQNLVQQSIAQLLLKGGAISLLAPEVVAASGSVINLTGGYVHYLGGMINTTLLIGSDGRLYNIGSADPNISYVGIAGRFTVDHPHWGVTEVYVSPLLSGGYYQPDYVQGANAGSLSINITDNSAFGQAIAGAGAFVFDATLLAQSIAGPRQVASGTLPQNGSFSLTGLLPIEIGDPSMMSASSLAASTLPANFPVGSAMLASTPKSPYAVANVLNSQTLNNAGLNSISLTTIVDRPDPPTAFQSEDAWIKVDAGASLTVQPGGTISLSAGNVTIDGSLTAHAGAISIATNPVINTGAGASVSNAFNNGYVPGDIVVGANGKLDVSGLFFNQAQSATLGQNGSTKLINGGSITLATNVAVPSGATSVDLTGDITLAAGSLLDLEGGGRILAKGTLQRDGAGVPLGQGGSLTIETYNGIGTPVVAGGFPARGRLTLAGAIDALGFNGGGTLTLQAAALQVGGDASTTPAGAFYFDPTRWGDLGFSSFVLNAVAQAAVPAGATVRLTHANLLPDAAMISSAPTGADIAAYSSVGYLTGTQLVPTNLGLTAGLEQSANYLSILGAPSGDAASIGLGAEILADPGAAIAITSHEMVTVFGAIHAPGGSISLAVNYPLGSSTPAGPAGPVYLGPQSVLDVAGVSVINPQPAPVNTLGRVVLPYTGKVLAGGTVNLFDDAGAILVAPGSVINVSGAADAFDVAQLGAGRPLGGGQIIVRQPVWSDAGTVNIEGLAGLLFEGTLIGNPGAPQAAGGTLNITGDRNSGTGSSGSIWLVQDTAAALAAAQASFSFATYVPTTQQHGYDIIDPNVPGGTLVFGVDSLTGSGFSNLTLTSTTGNVGFAGNVALTLNGTFNVTAYSLEAANAGNFAGALPKITDPVSGNLVPTTYGASLTVTAPYIALTGLGGANTNQPSDANLTLNAEAIDLSGGMTLGNIGQATFNSAGDIRLLPSPGGGFGGNGTSLIGGLGIAGNLTFAAAAVYPATDTWFTISAGANATTHDPGTVTFAYPQNGGPSSVTPLSANGELQVSAATIVQNGEIQAPFGQIVLGSSSTNSVTLGAGSITSVSANGAIIPYGSTVDQTTWVYNPLTNNPSWTSNNAAALNQPLTAAPQGVVTLNGLSVALNKGSVIDLSGGGDLQAQEWIAGTGGSRDVLSQYQTSYQNSVAGQKTPTYPDARQIYAILPGYRNALAPYDPTLSQSGLIAGQSIYLAGGDGLAAGYYTLLPAKYATLPGAYRVVVNSGVTNPLSPNVTLADGTMAIAGYTANSLTGTRSSTLQQFYVQPASTWQGYSQYALTSADSFFPKYAALNGLATPIIPADAGRLVIAATTSITLDGSLRGTAGPGGFGAQVDISGQNLDVTDSASGTTAITGSLNFSAPGASGSVPNGMTIVFSTGVSAADVFTVTGSGTLVVPSGATALQVIQNDGSSIVNVVGHSIKLPAGDSLQGFAGYLTVMPGSTDTLTVRSFVGPTLAPSSTTTVIVPDTDSYPDYYHYTEITGGGGSITITSPQPFSVGGVSATLSPKGLYTSTILDTDTVASIKPTVAGQAITWTTSAVTGALGVVRFDSSGFASSTTYTLAANPSSGGSTYFLSTATPDVTALSASDIVNGAFRLSGPAPADIILAAGRYAVTTGQQFSGLSSNGSTPVTFTANARDALTYTSGSGAVALSTSSTYLAVSAQQLDAFGGASLLIGGTRSYTSAGLVITPTALSLLVNNDAQVPLQAPELMLVAAPQIANTTVTLDARGDTTTIGVAVPNTGEIVINSGAVIKATGSVGIGEPGTILLGGALADLPTLPSSFTVSQINSGVLARQLQDYYAALDARLGSLVRVSNGGAVKVLQPTWSQLNPTITVTDNVNPTNPQITLPLNGLLSGGVGAVIQSGAQLIGGGALTLASTSNLQLSSGALLSGANIDVTASQITFAGGATSGGIDLAGAQKVNLQSLGLISFLGNVTLQMTGAGNSLTLGAAALSSDGGQVSISAPTIVLDNELGAPSQSFSPGAGSLSLNAGELIFGAGGATDASQANGVGAKTLQGFGSVNVVATQGVVGQGTGGMNFGSVPLTLQTPIVIADTGSNQIISTTSADINLVALAGAAPMTSNGLGGAIAFETQQSGSITVSTPIQALAGNISLLAATAGGTTGGGNVTVTGGGRLIAHGVAKDFGETMEYAPGGAITLSANAGVVDIQSGAVVDFSGAPGAGYGGSLAITTTNSGATVSIAANTLFGATAPGYAGSSFSLDSSGAVALDPLAQVLTAAGVTGAIGVRSGQGDLVLNRTLTANTVELVANGGLVAVNGAINASGTTGGTIALYGVKGVDVEGSLVATGSDPNRLGGVVQIATSGTPDGTYNGTYGYENVTSAIPERSRSAPTR